jgi:Ca2+-binding EF-hand superfamily protein
VAKKADNIRVEDVGLAFRQSGQNPTEDTVKDMIEKGKALKKSQLREQDEDDEGEQS